MPLTASKLRQDIYRILDHVIETGEAVIVERRGKRIRIVAEDTPSRIGALVRRPAVVVGHSEDLVHLDWSDEWTG